MIKIATIVGARPQFIKAATTSRAIAKHNKSREVSEQIEEIIIHTGQHYDDNMSKAFFDELQIPRPDYNLGVGSDSHGKQTGRMLAGIEDVLVQEKPDLVLIFGDTNSTLAGSLAAAKLHIVSGHVEAGLRSYNRRMPEEVNRIVADQLSNLLFCPTETAVRNLEKEGIRGSNRSRIKTAIFETRLVENVGDVMYDSLIFNEELAAKRSTIFRRLGIGNDGEDGSSYVLATIHRAENTDNKENLAGILRALREIAGTGINVIIPMHPRTGKKIRMFGLDKEFEFCTFNSTNPVNPSNSCNSNKRGRHTNTGFIGLQASQPPSIRSRSLLTLPPVGYLDMLWLEKHAKAILTDSGGVQKEAFLLGVPCITAREETEWVETVDAGWNTLAGNTHERIVAAFNKIEEWNGASPPFKEPRDRHCEAPYGDGNAAERIVETVFDVLR